MRTIIYFEVGDSNVNRICLLLLFSPRNKQENKPPDLTNPDAYNGAVTDTYCWSQSPTEVDVKVPVPSFVKKSRDIHVELKTDKLKVMLRNEPPAGKFNCNWTVI